MKHGFVAKEKDFFFGWPANNGVWSWGNEIVVGYTRQAFLEKDDDHSVDRDQESKALLSRSTDGGETWVVEAPVNYAGREPVALSEPIDFSHPDLAIRCWSSLFSVSYDRCRSWQGPYKFPDFGFTGLTARTDYLPISDKECLFFLATNDPKLEVQAGLADRAFSARTTDGGKSFSFHSWMLPENPKVRSVMPSTVRISDSKLVSVLRRRFDVAGDGKVSKNCWIDAAVSNDDGKTWSFLSKVDDTEAPGSNRNGNPPALVRLEDGRLCCAYGYRSNPLGMRVKISGDEGKTWGTHHYLRDDARKWDFGYPRMVVRPDGKIVTMYYYTTENDYHMHIASTIWSVDELD